MTDLATLRAALTPFAELAGGIPPAKVDSAPAARVDADARFPGTFSTLSAGTFRAAAAALGLASLPEIPNILFEEWYLGRRILWTEEDHDAVVEDGWHLDWYCAAIIAADYDDDARGPVFANSIEAHDFVLKRAEETNDERYMRALILDSLHTARVWTDQLKNEEDGQ